MSACVSVRVLGVGSVRLYGVRGNSGYYFVTILVRILLHMKVAPLTRPSVDSKRALATSRSFCNRRNTIMLSCPSILRSSAANARRFFISVRVVLTSSVVEIFERASFFSVWAQSTCAKSAIIHNGALVVLSVVSAARFTPGFGFSGWSEAASAWLRFFEVYSSGLNRRGAELVVSVSGLDSVMVRGYSWSSSRGRRVIFRFLCFRAFVFLFEDFHWHRQSLLRNLVQVSTMVLGGFNRGILSLVDSDLCLLGPYRPLPF